MKKHFILVCLGLILFQNGFGAARKPLNEPDSVYLFSYNANGLRFAWSTDKTNWTPIGDGYIYLKCDYSRWGSEKKMIAPYLIQGRKGIWECIWQLNDRTLQFAQAGSADLVNWGPQAYPYVKQSKNVLRPVISYNKIADSYTVVYTDANGKYFQTTTKDLKVYTPIVPVPASAYRDHSITANINGETKGQLHRVAWPLVDGLIKAYELQQYKSKQNSEITKDDVQRFAGLKTVEAKLTLQPEKAKAISTMLTGVFFEDLNYAADGGLYAELVQNRDFEYAPGDKQFRDKKWTADYAWSIKGDASFTIDSVSSLNINNPHYAVLDVKTSGAALVNSGYDAIAIKKGETYNFSAFLKQLSGANGPLQVSLVSDKAGVLAKADISAPSSGWGQIKASLVASGTAADVRLELQPLNTGHVAIDMVSLFPAATFKNHPNGLRADLAQAIADIHPRFVRFPGGCLSHGDGLKNIYRWKSSIGPLEARVPDRNQWNYHQTKGLGYFEYFQFCEDIGAEPVPVIAAGVSCQNSGTGGGGQQGGIPMSEMPQYTQDIIDLVEYANGGVNTTWGKKRAEAGHPAPFNLKYIGIGNEDQITEVFKERFTYIYKALHKAHPEITIIGTAGPFFEGTDYVEGWKIATNLKVPLIDEHYYQPPGWFINNQDFYDSYDRGKSKVYLGEYAASLPGGNKSYWETSLAEALYLTALERNGDVVSMASYAPLLAREGHTQWNPDLIYFNATDVKPTTGYYIQQLYGQNAGDHYIPAAITVTNKDAAVKKHIAWSVVRESKTNDLVIKLVNFLPVSVTSTIDLNGVKPVDGKATKTVLAGNPADKTVRPVVSETTLVDGGTIELPPYSFTVLRLTAK